MLGLLYYMRMLVRIFKSWTLIAEDLQSSKQSLQCYADDRSQLYRYWIANPDQHPLKIRINIRRKKAGPPARLQY